MKRLFFRITGGRPMQMVEHSHLWDAIGGFSVHLYRDRLNGQLWMATNSWSRFRVLSELNR